MNSVYDGIARVYLQGKRALQPMVWTSVDEVIYSIGTLDSNIEVHDLRQETNRAAINAINGVDIDDFLPKFSAIARVKIIEEEHTVKLVFKEPDQDPKEIPVCWIGAFEGERLNANPLEWYAARETSDHRTAFAALTNPE